MEHATATAKLVFTGERLVSLPKIADVIGEALRQFTAAPVSVNDVSLTGLAVTSAGITAGVDMAIQNAETVISVTVTQDDAPNMAILARLFFALASALPASHVVWADSALRIPRATFLAGLADTFGTATPAEAGKIAQISPRRIARNAARPTRHRRRPEAAASCEMTPLAPTTRARTVRATDTTYDAHVQAYETFLRSNFLREAEEAELEDVKTPVSELPIEARLSTWAVSLSVATVALPVAAPVMIYNVARGEDLRVASLAMGLAGLFVALDSAGAMAAVAGM